MALLKIFVSLVVVATLAEVRGESLDSHLMGSDDVADKKSHSYHVVITQKWFFTSEKYVGIGSLINQFWFITSASVASKIDYKWYHFGWRTKVKAGVDRMNEKLPHQVIGVEKVILHEFYLGESDNDIALVKLKYPGLVFNELVGSVQIPERDAAVVQDGIEITVTGWTAAHKDKKPLQSLAVNVIDSESCAKAYGANASFIDETLFCVRNSQERAVCADDLGSPGTVQSGDGRLLVGIFTMAEKSDKTGNCGTKPALFTRITHYSLWINANIH